MMDLPEIKRIIAEIVSKKRRGDVNTARLLALMEHAGFSPREFDAETRLQAIKRDARSRSSDGILSFLASALPRPRMIAGALAAAVIAIPSVFLYLWLFSSGDPSAGAVCSYVSGGVSLVREGRRVPLAVGMTLEAGDSIAAGGNALADFTVEGIAGFRVMEKTDMSFGDLAGNAPGRVRFDADVARGTVLFTFARLAPGDEASVRTPFSVAVIRGTSFGVRVDPGLNARYEVLSGRIAVGGRIETEAFPARLSPDEREALTPIHISAHQACTVSGDGSEKTRQKIQEVLARGGSVMEAIGSASKNTIIAVHDRGHADFVIMADLRNFINESARRGAGIASLKAYGVEDTVPGRSSGGITEAVKMSSLPDAGSFNFAGWAAGREWSSLAYSETDGLVIGAGREGVIEAVTWNASKWSVNLGSSITSPILLDANNVYITLPGEKILALSRMNGKTLWVFPLQGRLPAGSAVTHYDGRLYAATSKGFLYRLSPLGTADWIKKLDTEILTRPFAQGSSLFVMGNDGNLYRLGADDGEVKGTYALGSFNRGAIDSRMNRIYLAGRSGNLVCFDHEKIAVLWRYETGAPVSHVPIADRHGVCVLTDSGEVHGIGLSGERRWKVDLGSRSGLKATLSGNDLYVISERVLYMLDRHNGEVKWSYVTEAGPGTPVVVAGRNILFGSEGRGLSVMRR